jgi:hypothetical protein
MYCFLLHFSCEWALAAGIALHVRFPGVAFRRSQPVVIVEERPSDQVPTYGLGCVVVRVPRPAQAVRTVSGPSFAAERVRWIPGGYPVAFSPSRTSSENRDPLTVVSVVAGAESI